MPQEYRNFIGGEWVASSSGETIEVRNPADTDEVLGTVPSSTVADVRAAIGAAKDAFPKWAALTGPERGRILYHAANILETQTEEWTVTLTREEGKTRGESQREIVRSIELLRYFAGEAWRVGGDMLPADTPHTLLYSTRVPLGVVAIITPWNFPLSIPVWKIAPALVMGNTVIFKPASATPILAIKLAALLHEAGLPGGVLNVVTGAGGALGDALVTDERIDGVSFTGSYAVGRPGLHGYQPGDRRAAGGARVYRAFRGRRAGLEGRSWPGRGRSDGPGGQQRPACDRPGVCRDRPR